MSDEGTPGTGEIAAQLARIADLLQAQNTLLQGCSTALHGQWACCLEGRWQSDLLLEISMVHYKLPPDARWALYLERKAEEEGK